MKLNGLFGKGSGKLGSSVFAISGGEQVVREYNPVVSNPSTAAQVEQRAKFKLLSQLAASMAMAIAFVKNGLVSARNQFVSANYALVTFANNVANILLENIALTGSNYSFVGADVSRAAEGGAIDIDTGVINDGNIQKVVVVAFVREGDTQLRFHDSIIIDRSTGEWVPSREMTPSLEPLVVYQYGIIPTGSSSSISYEDYRVSVDQSAAALQYAQNLAATGAKLTATVGTLLS